MSKVDFLLSSFKYRAEKMSVFSSAKNHQIGKALLETLGLPLDPWSSVFNIYCRVNMWLRLCFISNIKIIPVIQNYEVG